MPKSGQMYFLKILQHLVQDFHRVPDHFGTLHIKGLKTDEWYFQHKNISFHYF